MLNEAEKQKLAVLLALGMQHELAQDSCRAIIGDGNPNPRAIHVLAAISWQLNDGCADATPAERSSVDMLLALR